MLPCLCAVIEVLTCLAAQSLVNRPAREMHQPGDDSDGLVLLVELPDQIFLLLRELDPGACLPAAPGFALGLGFGDAGELPFIANFGFVLADAGKHHQHQTAGRGRQIDAFTQGHKAHAELL